MAANTTPLKTGGPQFNASLRAQQLPGYQQGEPCAASGQCHQQSNQQQQPAASASKQHSARQKTPNMMAKRNARERQRVKAVNMAFEKLRKHIPYANRSKRLSKVKTLRIAIDYIRLLQSVLGELDAGVSAGSSNSYRTLEALIVQCV